MKLAFAALFNTVDKTSACSQRTFDRVFIHTLDAHAHKRKEPARAYVGSGPASSPATPLVQPVEHFLSSSHQLRTESPSSNSNLLTRNGRWILGSVNPWLFPTENARIF